MYALSDGALWTHSAAITYTGLTSSQILFMNLKTVL
jgi:hypothetical protein